MNSELTQHSNDTESDSSRFEERVTISLAEVITLAGHSRKSNRDNAIVALLVHVANTWKAIAKLCDCDSNEELRKAFANPTVSLVRCIYDAFIQMQYIMAKESEVESRARQYLEFQIVELRCYMRAVSSTPEVRMQNDVEKKTRKAEVRRVEEEYKDFVKKWHPRGDTPGAHWYPGRLPQLAKAAGQSRAYQRFVLFSNSSVHAGPLSVLRGPLIPANEFASLIGADVASKSAMTVVTAMNLDISNETRECFESIMKHLEDATSETC